MKPILLSLVCLFGAGSAGAEVIRWSYFENPLTYDATASSLESGDVPFALPATAGPLLFSFEVDSADFADLGLAPVLLPAPLTIDDPLPPGSLVQNILASANAAPALSETWDTFGQFAVTIGTDGDIAAWDIQMAAGFGNSTLAFSEGYDTSLSFYRTDFATYAGTVVYGGSGGTWVRSGGDALFPVPLPAAAPMLAGAVGCVLALRRRRNAKGKSRS